MAFVVTDSCIRCKFMDCVAPCPVDCFHEGPDFVAINPDECIDCNVCAVECPVGAIYQDKDLPEGQKEFIELNRKFSQVWPRAVAGVSKPHPEAEKWRHVSNKRDLLLGVGPVLSEESR